MPKIIKCGTRRITQLNDVLTHLETYALAPRGMDEAAWIALVYSCTCRKAEKLIADARDYERAANAASE